MAYQKRLKKEYEELSKRPPEGITLDPSTLQDNIDASIAPSIWVKSDEAATYEKITTVLQKHFPSRATPSSRQ